MSAEFPGEDVQDALSHPPALGEGGEGEVVGVDLAQTCGEKVHKMRQKATEYNWRVKELI